ncbi:hypothetical protein D3C76_448460 [compost metagenome]
MESCINLQNTFFYLELQQDHLVLFKYHKPFFMIMGPEHIYQNEIIYGKLFVIYSDTGQEQILLFGDSFYIVAENFEVKAIELNH